MANILVFQTVDITFKSGQSLYLLFSSYSFFLHTLSLCLSFYSVSFYSLFLSLYFLLWITPMTHIEISISVTVNIFVHKCHKNYWLDHWQAMDMKGTWGQSYITAKANTFQIIRRLLQIIYLGFSAKRHVWILMSLYVG